MSKKGVFFSVFVNSEWSLVETISEPYIITERGLPMITMLVRDYHTQRLFSCTLRQLRDVFSSCFPDQDSLELFKMLYPHVKIMDN